MYTNELQAVDPTLNHLMRAEEDRQRCGLELIASENYVSAAVMAAMGSVLNNRYSEGYPGARYYGGQEVMDEIERLAIARATKLFGCGFANVQPHAGAPANLATYLGLCEPGDTILGMDLSSRRTLDTRRARDARGQALPLRPLPHGRCRDRPHRL